MIPRVLTHITTLPRASSAYLCVYPLCPSAHLPVHLFFRVSQLHKPWYVSSSFHSLSRVHTISAMSPHLSLVPCLVPPFLPCHLSPVPWSESSSSLYLPFLGLFPLTRSALWPVSLHPFVGPFSLTGSLLCFLSIVPCPLSSHLFLAQFPLTRSLSRFFSPIPLSVSPHSFLVSLISSVSWSVSPPSPLCPLPLFRPCPPAPAHLRGRPLDRSDEGAIVLPL